MKRTRSRSTKDKRPAKRARSFDNRVIAAVRRKSDMKTVESGLNYTYAPNTGLTTSVLTPIARGDGSVNNFNGEKIVPHSWTVRWQAEAYGVLESATEQWCSGRILLIQWLNSGSAPAASNILDLTVPGPLSTLTYKKWEGRKKYRILADSGCIPLGIQTAGGGGNGYLAAGKFFIPRSKLRDIYFDDATGREKGDLSVIIVGDGTTSPGVNFAWTSQVVFTDDI